MYYLYILESEVNGRYYIGITSNVKKRLGQHNAGKTKSTKAYIPWRLNCKVEYTTRKEAAVAERKLKNSKSRIVIEKYMLQQAESR
ncbi:MAG: GIY-YIG nuclease family protein [Candidatus Marinimicrobia bacterium]|nr:GIY-YIG nuclease family protein [Candidatus Neomarinimicrobiota bacterium]